MKNLILRMNQEKVRPEKKIIKNNEREAIIQRIKEAVKRKWVVKLSRISPMAIKIYSSAAENRTKKFCEKVNIYARKQFDPYKITLGLYDNFLTHISFLQKSFSNASKCDKSEAVRDKKKLKNKTKQCRRGHKALKKKQTASSTGRLVTFICTINYT